MSGEGRPTEWLPLAILGGLIIAVDLVIVVSELVSPTLPSPASGSSSSAPTSTGRSSRDQALNQPAAVSPRSSPIRAPQDIRETSGTPRGIAVRPSPQAREDSPPPAAAAPPHDGAAMRGLSPVAAPVRLEPAEAGVADADHGGQ